MVLDTEFPPRQRNLLPIGNEPKAGPTSGAEGPWGLPTSMAGGSSRAGSAASPEVGRRRRAEGRDTPTVRVSRERRAEASTTAISGLVTSLFGGWGGNSCSVQI